jgi:hypothetical protein
VSWYFTAMAKRSTNMQQQDHSWAVYHIKGTPAKLVAIIDAPDAVAAIALAIEVENVPPDAHLAAATKCADCVRCLSIRGVQPPSPVGRHRRGRCHRHRARQGQS